MRVTLPVLLPSRLHQIVRIVERAHDDFLLRIAGQERRHIDGEGRVSALVRPGQPPVDPDGRGMVDRAEVQQQPIASGEAWCHDCASVPTRAIESCVADAAQRRFW